MLFKIIELRHTLHQNPELSHEEHVTRQILMDFLEENTDLVIKDMGSWFYAVYDCGDPAAEAVAYRADFDALPIPEPEGLPYRSLNRGISHTCGHDGHSAALAGFAWYVGLKKPKKNVYFIFQHAEEVGGGGEECAALIREKGIRRVYAFHNMSGWPENTVLVRPGITHCASRGLTVTFTGKTAHASTPENGTNPACAAAELVLAIREAAEEPYDSMVLATVVNVSVGSRNFGIAPADGEVSVTLRSGTDGDLAKLEEKILHRARMFAERDGLTMTTREEDIFPATVNDPAEAERVRQAALDWDLDFLPLPEPYRASEDFGYYLRECPGAMFYIGNGEDWPPIHAEGYDFNDGILMTAIQMFYALL